MILAKLTPPDQLKAYELYKYVRLQSGEFRFTLFCGLGPDHAHMVEQGEPVISAGCVIVTSDGWKFVGYGSDTCRVGWLRDDPEWLTHLIGKPNLQGA